MKEEKVTDRYVLGEGKQYTIDNIDGKDKVIDPNHIRVREYAVMYRNDIIDENNHLIKDVIQFTEKYMPTKFEKIDENVWQSKLFHKFEYQGEHFEFAAIVEFESPNIFRFYKVKPCDKYTFEITVLESESTNKE